MHHGRIVGIMLGFGTAYPLSRSFQWNTQISRRP
jgi:hypothetical protein